MNGGYDDGYSCCRCFWGKSPGSLVRRFLSETRSVEGLRILDLGCGEGKNAYAFAQAGAKVVAVDCSKAALANGQRELAHRGIEWVLSDVEAYLRNCSTFDIVIMYGLLHCLPSMKKICSVVRLALMRTILGGQHLVVIFNDGPQDLTAHPGFSPTLLPHKLYVDLYRDQKIIFEQTDMIHETHPNNDILHYHSLTRLSARRLL